ncbi:LysR substrate-binding domain-containing protein [Phytohalomonas tamaricis]|uniref:LysR substrate-binding domain-containing protein n=1 Tax=Phytohalomonas tamaricis TaxID=2081032 RepID=UPI000D0B47D1|nr:LysR substrate-binding domain-containing protein [Phytohalomonas tamaricis]
MRRLPPLAWMQAFEAAARHLSFTAAGDELGVTQSAISQRIRLLEGRLGQALFIRHPRSLELSDAGRAWLPSIQNAFARLEEGTSEVFGPELGAPVTIRATPGVQQYWLAPRLCQFHHAHPEIDLRIVTAVWSQQFGLEDADVEIRYGRGEWSDVVVHSLGEEIMTPVCAPEVAKTLHAPADLVGHTLLHAAGFALGWPAWLDVAGVKGLEEQCQRLICDTQVMTLRLAAYGCGVALVHRRLVGERDELVAPFTRTLPTQEGFWLVRPARRELRDVAATVWDWLAGSDLAATEST